MNIIIKSSVFPSREQIYNAMMLQKENEQGLMWLDMFYNGIRHAFLMFGTELLRQSFDGCIIVVRRDRCFNQWTIKINKTS